MAPDWPDSTEMGTSPAGSLIDARTGWAQGMNKSNLLAILAIGAVLCAMPAHAQVFPLQNGPVPENRPIRFDPSIQFDPATCSTDSGGMYYFAVGSHVFRQPMESTAGLPYSEDPKYIASLPQPPIPTDPVGCPGHPLQQSGYGFSPFVSTTDTQQSRVARGADRLRVGLNNVTQAYEQNHLFQLCQTHDHPDMTMPGFVGCIISGCGISVTCFYSRVFQAIDHLSPNGAKMTLYCQGALDFKPFPIHCGASYMLYPDVAVLFGFDPRDLPIETSLAAETELRRRLRAAEVANYQWSPSTLRDKKDR